MGGKGQKALPHTFRVNVNISIDKEEEILKTSFFKHWKKNKSNILKWWKHHNNYRENHQNDVFFILSLLETFHSGGLPPFQSLSAHLPPIKCSGSAPDFNTNLKLFFYDIVALLNVVLILHDF